MPTPDLLAVLREIQDKALDTERKFRDGLVVNGRTAIIEIKHLAGDAIEDAEAEHQEAAA